MIIPETVREEDEDENITINQLNTEGKSSKDVIHLEENPTLNDSKTDQGTGICYFLIFIR